MHNLTLSEAHAEYLDGRGLSLDRVADHVASRGAALGFLYKQGPRVLSVKWRTPKDDGSSKSFLREPAGAPPIAFNANSLWPCQDGATLVITEGEIDCLSVMSAAGHAFPHVVSVPDGGSAGSERQTPQEAAAASMADLKSSRFAWMFSGDALLPVLGKYARIILATDADEVGVRLRTDLALRLGPERCCAVSYPPGCKDLNDVLVRHGDDGVLDVLGAARPLVPTRAVRLSDIPDQPVVALSSGWPRADAHLMISFPSLVFVTGVPNSGKSQWTMNLGLNLARCHQARGLFIQGEDSVGRMRRTVLRYATAWRNGRDGHGQEPAAWMDAFVRIARPPRYAEADEARTLDWLLTTIESAAVMEGCKWVVIDPWNEIEHVWNRGEREDVYLNRALRQLRSLAERLDLCLVVVAHPSKGIAGKSIDEMTLYDMAGGAAWANKADIGIIIARGVDADLLTYVKVAKVRDQETNGRPGTITMSFTPGTSSYTVVADGVAS